MPLLFLSTGSFAGNIPVSTGYALLLDDADLSRNYRQTLPGANPVFSNGIDRDGFGRLNTRARRVQDMAAQDHWEVFLDYLRTGSEQLLILVEDPESELGWRLFTKGDVNTLRQIMDQKARESATLPSKLCYNLEEAAQLVGVSAHKFNGWLKRSDHPIPHIQDGRRIIIPGDMLAEWLRDEALRNILASSQ